MAEVKKTESNLHEAYKSKRGPKAIIDFFFFKVNIFESLMVIIISLLLSISFYWLLKGPGLFVYSLRQIFSTVLINWILLGIIMFLLMYFIRGQKSLPKKPFEKVLSALASFRLITIIYWMLVAVIVVVFFPAIISIMKAILQNPNLINSATLVPALTIMNIIGIILFGILTIFILIYWIIMLFEFTEIVFDVKDVGSKIGLMLLTIVILVLINLLV